MDALRHRRRRPTGWKPLCRAGQEDNIQLWVTEYDRHWFSLRFLAVISTTKQRLSKLRQRVGKIQNKVISK